MPRKAKHNRPPGFTRERAEFWRVSVRVLQNWLQKNVPVESVEKMIDWYAALPSVQQTRLTPEFRARITELRLKSSADSSAALDPEWNDFEKVYSANKPGDQTALDELKKLAAFYRHKQLRCSQRNDHAAASAALNLLKDLSSVIHDMELRALKAGRDLDDLIPKSTIEQVARFLAYHLLRCADAAHAEIVAALTVSDPAGAPLLPEEIAARLEPILLNAFVLQPIVRAAQGNNPAAPPDWLVAALQAGAAEVLEEIQLNQTPVPQVPA